MDPESQDDRLKGVQLNLQPKAPDATATPSAAAAAAVLSIDVPYSCNSISNVQYRHADGKDPSITPVMWVLLWVALAAGFLQSYATNGTFVFAALPACFNYFYPAYQYMHTKRLFLGFPAAPAPTATTTPGFSRKTNYYCRSASPGAAQFIGAFLIMLAPLLAAGIASKFGRKCSIFLGAVACVVAQGLLAGSFHRAMFFVGAAVGSAGAGILQTAVILEDAEIAPRRWRGAYMAVNVLGQGLGWLVASVLGVAVADVAEQWAWRCLFAMGALPGCTLLLVLKWLPETPHSLLFRGKAEEAKQALRTVKGPFVSVSQEIAEIAAAAGHDPSVAGQARIFFGRELRAPLLLTVTLLLAQELHGNITTIQEFNDAHGTDQVVGLDNPAALMFKARWIIMAAAQTAGALLAILLLDRVGRRPLLACCCGVSAACFAGISVLFSPAIKHAANGGVAPLAAFVVMGGLIEMCSGAGWFSTWNTLAAELHCLRTRALAVAFSVSSLMLLDTLSFLARAPMLCHMGYGAEAFFAVCNAVNAVLVWLLLPETKLLHLEQIKHVYEHHWLWKRLQSPPGISSIHGNSTEQLRDSATHADVKNVCDACVSTGADSVPHCGAKCMRCTPMAAYSSTGRLALLCSASRNVANTIRALCWAVAAPSHGCTNVAGSPGGRECLSSPSVAAIRMADRGSCT